MAQPFSLTTFENGVQSFDGVVGMVLATPPLSGTSGTGAGDWATPGTVVSCLATGTQYFNEGSLASPYWSPISVAAPGLQYFGTDFHNGAGKPLADTTTTATLVEGGVRVHGQGIDETDSGLTVVIGEAGNIASLVTTDEVSHVAALGAGSNAGGGPYQPDTHGPIVVEATVAQSSALTLREFFIGFLGTAADALDPPVTGSTVTLTLVQDDLAGLFFSSVLTAATSLFGPRNKSDAAASMTTTQAALDTPTVFPAAGTYMRLRVEISAAGVMTCFADKVQVLRVVGAVDVDEELYPALTLTSTSTATKTALLKRFATWGTRA